MRSKKPAAAARSRPAGRPRAARSSPLPVPTGTDTVTLLQRQTGNRAVTGLLSERSGFGGRGVVERVGTPQMVWREDTKETVDVTITWKTTAPKAYLRTKVLDVHPPDWAGDVYVDGKKVASGDGAAVVELTVGARPRIQVKPTAMKKPADYFLATGKGRVRIKKSTSKIARPLTYNRSNKRFYEASWEHKKLDVKKVGDTEKKTLLGQTVTLNKLTAPRVAAANNHWKTVPEQERKEAADSIVSMGGYNRRTTSSGAYSNHSTGCAVDINAHLATKQNHHFKKKNKGDKQLMSLVAKVVALHPDFKGYDPWKESDSKRILAASDAFDAEFPGYLAGLLDEVVPKDKAGGGFSQELVDTLTKARAGEAATKLNITAVVDKKVLRRAIRAANKAKKADVVANLSAIRAQWSYLRAWIEGIVVYKTWKRGAREWAYRRDHEAAVAAGKRKESDVHGSLQGMVDIHPRIVESMIAGGWHWLVTSHSAKDFMHFEDRTAQAALKK